MTAAVTVADIMRSAVRTVARDTPVSELVAVLAAAKVTGLPVVDARERVIGVVSSTDLIAAQAGMRCAAEREILMEQTPSATSWRRSRS
jgi:CBS-domain-containing membrane protein